MNGPQWNDYASRTATPLNRMNPPCDAATTTHFSQCINGGWMRMISLPREDCIGVTVEDSLGVFRWICDDSVTPARAVSTGFNTGKGLQDLLDFSIPAWLPISVTVFQTGSDSLFSQSSAWWTNPVFSVPLTGGNLDYPGAIYVVTSPIAARISLDAEKISLVTAPGVTIAGGSAFTDIVAAQLNFNWIEIALHNEGAPVGVSILGGMHTVLWNTRIHTSVLNSPGAAIFQASARKNLFAFVRTTGIEGGAGVVLSGQGNVVVDSNFSSGSGGLMTGTSQNTVVGSVFSATSVALTTSGRNNVIADVTVANASSLGVVSQSSRNALVTGLASINTPVALLCIDDVDSAFVNAATYHNTSDAGFEGAGNADISLINSHTNRFLGTWLSRYRFLVDGGVADSPGSFSTFPDNGVRDEFLGRITGVDDSNASDGGPTAPEHWWTFENRFRAWGSSRGDVFPAADMAGPCPPSGVGCAIWDWSLAAGSTLLLNALTEPLTGQERTTHVWDGTGGSDLDCERVYPGANHVAGRCESTFLRASMEVFFDANGNDNYLCESGETCVLTRSLGAYQGHGQPVVHRRILSGAVSPVTLLRYSTTGR